MKSYSRTPCVRFIFAHLSYLFQCLLFEDEYDRLIMVSFGAQKKVFFLHTYNVTVCWCFEILLWGKHIDYQSICIRT